MHVAALRIELRIPNVNSLKQKRRVVKSVTAMMTSTFPVAVAEVDHQDLWQRADLGVALVAPHASHLTRMLHAVERAVREREDVELLGVGTYHLEAE